MSSIGERLRAERDRLGLNQEAFGALGGVNRNSQANYEKGSRTPDAEYLAALALEGVDILYVVTGARTPTPETTLSEHEAQLVNDFRKMRSEDQGSAKRLLRALAETSND